MTLEQEMALYKTAPMILEHIRHKHDVLGDFVGFMAFLHDSREICLQKNK